jgi:hypothetical protein
MPALRPPPPNLPERIAAPSLEKFSGGTTASQAVLTTLQHCAGRSTIISHQHWRR